jgi:hypothetical protein
MGVGVVVDADAVEPMMTRSPSWRSLLETAVKLPSLRLVWT